MTITIRVLPLISAKLTIITSTQITRTQKLKKPSVEQFENEISTEREKLKKEGTFWICSVVMLVVGMEGTIGNICGDCCIFFFTRTNNQNPNFVFPQKNTSKFATK